MTSKSVSAVGDMLRRERVLGRGRIREERFGWKSQSRINLTGNPEITKSLRFHVYLQLSESCISEAVPRLLSLN